MADDQNDAAGYLGWFFLGALVGAGAALLLAPQTGKEARDLLAEKGSELAKKAREATGDAQLRAGDLLEKGREFFEDQTQRLAAAFEAGKDAMREEIAKAHSQGT